MSADSADVDRNITNQLFNCNQDFTTAASSQHHVWHVRWVLLSYFSCFYICTIWLRLMDVSQCVCVWSLNLTDHWICSVIMLMSGDSSLLLPPWLPVLSADGLSSLQQHRSGHPLPPLLLQVGVCLRCIIIMLTIIIILITQQSTVC